jgi:hypothetical protein
MMDGDDSSLPRIPEDDKGTKGAGSVTERKSV